MIHAPSYQPALYASPASYPLLNQKMGSNPAAVHFGDAVYEMRNRGYDDVISNRIFLPNQVSPTVLLGKQVLDFCCGDEAILIADLLIREPRLKIDGINDKLKPVVKQLASSVNVKLYQEDVTKRTSLKSNHYDVVMASYSVLWHPDEKLEKQIAALSEIHRVLKPNGLVYISPISPQLLDHIEQRRFFGFILNEPVRSEMVDLPSGGKSLRRHIVLKKI